MKSFAKTSILLIPGILSSALLITACSADSVVKNDPYNDSDSQRSRAKQSQDEMSSDTSK